jgi:sugar phosphate isomerase/epimerase
MRRSTPDLARRPPLRSVRDARIGGHPPVVGLARFSYRVLPMPNDTPAERSWNYVTLGHGHDESFWRQFCAALTEVGYHDVLSIEHEDPTVDPIEAIGDTVDLLHRVSPASAGAL